MLQQNRVPTTIRADISDHSTKQTRKYQRGQVTKLKSEPACPMGATIVDHSAKLKRHTVPFLQVQITYTNNYCFPGAHNLDKYMFWGSFKFL
jgi:hypothetical protein